MIGLSQLSISLGSQVVGNASPYSATVTGLTNNATHGQTAQIAVSLTGVIAGLEGGETVVHRWTLDGDVISGATTANYSPIVANDQGLLRYSPTIDGVERSSVGYTVRREPPVAGSLTAVDETLGDGAPQVNLAPGFTGNGLRYVSSEPWATVPTNGSILTILDEERADTVDITATNSGGSAVVTLSVTIATRAATTFYVDPGSGDDANDGSIGSPLETPEAAIALAVVAGDTVSLRAGTYVPYDIVSDAGTSMAPIVITGYPGETIEVVGDLQSHSAYTGGAAVAQDNSVRDAIYVKAQSNLIIKDMTLRDCWRAGVAVFGGEAGETFGNITLQNLTVYNTGASAIRVEGRNSDNVIGVDEDGAPRLDGIIIENCTAYSSNMPNDNISADTETISVATGVANVITRNNTVGNSSIQTTGYGIDYKAGVRGGVIYGNTVLNHTKYGIYCDAGRRWVSGIDIYDNTVYDCQNMVVLAREAAPVAGFVDYASSVASLGASEFVQELSSIRVFNNVGWDLEESSIFLQKHPRDGGDGIIQDIDVRFNTVYNARRVTGSDLNLFNWSTLGITISNVVIAGNIFWNTEGSVTLAQAFSNQTGFTYDDNLTGSDPLFVDQDAATPDLTLYDNSPALGSVAATYAASPFNEDVDGTSRGDPANAGYSEATTVAFSVNLDEGTGELEITGNDGSSFVIDDAADNYDGTYAITVGSLASGPIALVAPVLAGDGSPEAGETLTVTPALFAYDGDLGAMTVAYTTTGTNSVNVTDPSNPTLLIDAADAGTSITVTATATQGANDTVSASNSLAIPSAMSAERLALVASSVLGTDVTFTIDLSEAANGDRLAFVYGTMSATEPTITVDGVAVPANAGNSGDQGPGGRLWVYDMPMTGAGSATALVDIDSGNSSGHIIAAVLVKGATLDAVDVSYNGGSDVTHDNSVTAAASPNLVVAVALGRSDYFTSYSWAGAVEQGLSAPVLGARSGSIAIATDVAAGPYQVSFTTGADAATNSETGIALMAYS